MTHQIRANGFWKQPFSGQAVSNQKISLTSTVPNRSRPDRRMQNSLFLSANVFSI
ncbi:hypothetical protein AHF37_11920 [Paragonimus kellicotti]|nr:hypothetical protein AHF37_11920 [Paragonimus kellicotti]